MEITFMKKRFLLLTAVILLTCFSAIRAADIRELFLQMPDKTLKDVKRAETILENESENEMKNKFHAERTPRKAKTII